ncbi:MAG: hypothetical protein ACRCYR_12610 [Phycicoccus sp.]
MTQHDQTAVDVVPGEMQPWTDEEPARPPAGGPVLLRLLADLLPSGGHGLVVGPHDETVLRLLADRLDAVTVLRRSPVDATAVADLGITGVTAVTGSLDGWSTGEHQPADVLVALDGLDRVTTTDSPDLDWDARLAAALAAAAPDALVLLRHDNEFTPVRLFDARPIRDRDGDRDWFPLASDPSRPLSPTDLMARLEASGRAPTSTWVLAGEPHASVALESGAAIAARPDGPATDLLVAAAESTAAPLLAAPGQAVRDAARAGLVVAMAPAWLIVAGRVTTDPAGSLYASGQAGPDDAGAPSAADAAPAADAPADGAPPTAGTASTDSASPAEGAPAADAPPAADEVSTDDDATRGVVDSSPLVVATLGEAGWSLGDRTVPDTASAEAALLRYCETEDVPAFRALAARLGEWLLEQPAETTRAIGSFADIRVDDDTFAPGFTAATWPEHVSAVQVLAAMWWGLDDRLVREHRRQPWPPWTEGAGRVAIWLGMSGGPSEADDLVVVRGLELASSRRAGYAPEVPDLRSRLADADRALHDLVEARGHIAGLERTIGFRDQQLRTRTAVIRELRRKVAKVERIKATPAFKVADRARRAAKDPKRYAGKAVRKARTVVKKAVPR